MHAFRGAGTRAFQLTVGLRVKLCETLPINVVNVLNVGLALVWLAGSCRNIRCGGEWGKGGVCGGME